MFEMTIEESYIVTGTLRILIIATVLPVCRSL